MMNPSRRASLKSGRPLDIDEIRLVSDLRIMHAKVDELAHLVKNLKRRHDESDVCGYADEPVLADDITKVDEIYLWFVKLKDEIARSRRRA
jgi:hypothetical protein